MHVIAFDFETAGGVPLKNGFTQLGAVLFNMDTGKVEDTFNEYASMKGYEWEERCVKEFWSRFPETFEETKKICAGSTLSPYQVVNNFTSWVQRHAEKLNHEVYMITDCSTFDSGILKCFSSVDTLYLTSNFPRDIVDVGNVYLGIAQKYNSINHIDGSAFKTCIAAMGITETFIGSKFHDHNPVNDATCIAEKWHFVNKFLRNERK